jgi:hypothetical protein
MTNHIICIECRGQIITDVKIGHCPHCGLVFEKEIVFESMMSKQINFIADPYMFED